MSTRLKYYSLDGELLYEATSNSVPNCNSYVLVMDKLYGRKETNALLLIAQVLTVHDPNPETWDNQAHVFVTIEATGDEALKQASYCK